MARTRSSVPTFGRLLRTAWVLSRSRIPGLVALALLPLLPILAFFIVPAPGMPVGQLFESGVLPALWFRLLVFAGLIVVFILSKVSVVGMVGYLADPRIHGGRMALQYGLKRWLPYVWTELLVAVIVLVVMAPGILLGWWLLSSFTADVMREGAHAAFLLGMVVPVILLLPGVAVAVRYAFAPLAVAAGAPAGPSALSLSSQLTAGRFWTVLGLLALWMLVQIVAVRVVSQLPVLSWLAPYFVGAFSLAYFVALYRALHRLSA